MLTVKAPAKINLTLEVLGKRDDGFHEIRSVIQALDLCDTLQFEQGDDVTISCDMPEWTAEESLVSKAVSLVKETTEYKKGVSIKIRKQIPLMSGLGGDSSDAAAVLQGLNELWELNLKLPDLQKLAGKLGSDVYFFLRGGTALIEGRGDIVTPINSYPPVRVVLAIPPVPRTAGKTGQLYGTLEASHYTDGQITRRFTESLEKGGEPDHSLLFNTFENVAFESFPGLDAARAHFLKMGAPFVHLAGSGPTLFTILNDKEKAEELCSLLRKQNMQAYTAETFSGQTDRNKL
ncbi:4-(cytidine 5'-diphospho)-2-C-methyl-D-erythritol kinase [Chloroflexota bacterium]